MWERLFEHIIFSGIIQTIFNILINSIICYPFLNPQTWIYRHLQAVFLCSENSLRDVFIFVSKGKARSLIEEKYVKHLQVVD